MLKVKNNCRSFDSPPPNYAPKSRSLGTLKKTFGARFAQDDSHFFEADHQGTIAVLISVERFISFSKTRLSS
jgi:hypothetical protein